MNQYTGFQIVRKYCAAAAIALAGGLVFVGAPAQATLIWNLDTSQCSDSANTNGVCDAGFAVRAIFEFSNIDEDSIDVQITVINSSTVTPAPLAAFGFSAPTGLSTDDSENDDDDDDDDEDENKQKGKHDDDDDDDDDDEDTNVGAVANGTLPTGWHINLGSYNFGFLDVGNPATANVCISLKDGSCFGTSGNPNVVANAIDSGEEAVFDFTLDNLDGDGSRAFATVAAYEDAFSNGNPVFFRFKPLEGVLSDPGSVKFGGTRNIPEPGSLALFGIGLAGLGAIRRRRKAA